MNAYSNFFPETRTGRRHKRRSRRTASDQRTPSGRPPVWPGLVGGRYRPLSQQDTERFVCFEKADFVGREALLRRKQSGVNTRLVYAEVDAENADVRGGEPIWAEGNVIGVATSDGYGHSVGKSLAVAYVTPQYAAPNGVFEIEILGEKRAASVLTQPAYDPKKKRLQS